MSVVMIDCGHGGGEPNGSSTTNGSIGPGGLCEKDITLALGRRIADRMGGRARLTRQGDENPSLAQRAAAARSAGAQLFLSVHAGGATAGAAQPWVHTRATSRSRALGESLHRELARLGGSSGLGAAELAVLTPEWLPAGAAACLLEVGDLKTIAGERLLRDPARLDRIAERVARGARAALGGDDTGLLPFEPTAPVAPAGDFWAVWCENESVFVSEIFLSESAARREAWNHMQNRPLHRAFAYRLMMGESAAPLPAGGQAMGLGYAGVLRNGAFRVNGGGPATTFDIHIPPTDAGVINLTAAGNVSTNGFPRPVTLQLHVGPWSTDADTVRIALAPSWSGPFSASWSSGLVADRDYYVDVWTPESDPSLSLTGDITISVA